MMTFPDVQDYLKLLPAMKQVPDNNVWLYYDREADALYVNFKPKPNVATNSELTENDVIVRYADEQVIGMTILHASQR